MKNKSGITLIALIITIIVMLILVAVSVQILIKSDLIGTAESAGEAYKIAHEKEQNLKEVIINGKTYASIEEYKKELEGETAPLEHSGIIPEGGVYTAADGTVYEEGDEFPTIATGDVYIYEDYEYRYNANLMGFEVDNTSYAFVGWFNDDNQNGWGVNVLDRNKKEYREILYKINGKDVNTLMSTFADCKLMTQSPKIPNTITNMMDTFYYCTALVTTPEIPRGVKLMNSTFNGCILLINAPEISDSVTNMNRTFRNCSSLTGSIKINTNPTDYDYCFEGVDFATQEITLTGSSTILDEIGATGDNYCATCNGACAGNH